VSSGRDPSVFLGFAAGRELEAALRASSYALVASLVVIAHVAVRRVRLWQRLVVLVAESTPGLLVLVLELLAQG
jgi:hypothetical protein